MATVLDKRIEMSDLAIQQINAKQLEALQGVINNWPKDYTFIVRVNFGVIDVQVMNEQGERAIFIGIEEDGYTHS